MIYAHQGEILILLRNSQECCVINDTEAVPKIVLIMEQLGYDKLPEADAILVATIARLARNRGNMDMAIASVREDLGKARGKGIPYGII